MTCSLMPDPREEEQIIYLSRQYPFKFFKGCHKIYLVHSFEYFFPFVRERTLVLRGVSLPGSDFILTAFRNVLAEKGSNKM